MRKGSKRKTNSPSLPSMHFLANHNSHPQHFPNLSPTLTHLPGPRQIIARLIGPCCRKLSIMHKPTRCYSLHLVPPSPFLSPIQLHLLPFFRFPRLPFQVSSLDHTHLI